MKVYPGAKMLKSFSPKENDLFSGFGRARHHGKCSKAPSVEMTELGVDGIRSSQTALLHPIRDPSTTSQATKDNTSP
jgi:hypothetical protein